MRKLLLASAALAIMNTEPTLAADRAAEMKTLEETFFWYLPENMKNSLSIEPSGEGYLTELDLKTIFNQAFGSFLAIKNVTSASQLMTPLANGLWKVEGDQPFELSLTIHDKKQTSDISYKFDQFKFDGTFDPALSYYRDMTGYLSNVQMIMDDGRANVAMTVKDGNFNLAATGLDPKAINIAGSGKMFGLHEVIVDPKSGQVTMDVGEMAFNAKLDGANMLALKAVLGFVLNRQGDGPLNLEEQEKLVAIAKEAMPIWGGLEESITASDISVRARDMTFQLDEFGYGLEMDGVTNDASFAVNVSYGGIKLPPGALPSGTDDALPQEVSVQVAVEELDLGDAADYFFKHADLRARQPLTQNQGKELVEILLPNGQMKLGFHDIVARSDVYDLTAEGAMIVYPGVKDRVSAHFVLYARDFDKTIAFLQKNAMVVPQFGQAAFFALMVKGFAAADDDGRLKWDVEISEDREFKINGQVLPFMQ